MWTDNYTIGGDLSTLRFVLVMPSKITMKTLTETEENSGFVKVMFLSQTEKSIMKFVSNKQNIKKQVENN